MTQEELKAENSYFLKEFNAYLNKKKAGSSTLFMDVTKDIDSAIQKIAKKENKHFYEVCYEALELFVNLYNKKEKVELKTIDKEE